MTIKVGDKVEYVGNAYGGVKFGVVTSVIQSNSHKYPYMVSFIYGNHFSDLICSEDELVIVTNGSDLWHNSDKPENYL